MIAILGPVILRHPEIKGSMETVIVQKVLPEFKAPEGYMRYIAAEVVGVAEVNNIKWTNEAHLRAARRS